MPAVDSPRGSRAARRTHLRVGAAGAVLLITGLAVTGLLVGAEYVRSADDLLPLALGALLAAISVFAPTKQVWLAKAMRKLRS